MQPSSATLPRKTSSTFTAPAKKGIPFGAREARIRPIDAFATTTDYEPELAYLLSIVSTWAYADEQVLGDKLRYYGFGGAHIRRVTVQNNALLVVTTAYLIQSASGKVAVLAFRGTDPGNLITVLTDGQVMQREFGGGRVHSGFYLSVEVVWDEIHQALDMARKARPVDDDKRRVEKPGKLEALYVTGHSLGGAMAMLAASRLCEDDYKSWNPEKLLRGVYTFGQPRVGDSAFARACEARFGKKLFRHVYKDDVVPTWPPRSGFDYEHSAGEWRSSGPRSGWTFTPEVTRRSLLGASVLSTIVNLAEARLSPRDRIPGVTLEDHLPLNYMEASRLALEADPGKAAARAPLLPAFMSRALSTMRARIDGAATSVFGPARELPPPERT